MSATTAPTDSTSIATFDFVPGLPLTALHDELRRARDITALGRRKLALYLRDMQDRGVHILSGHASAVHFATARLEMDKRRAQEFVHIGGQLLELPEVDRVLVAGELSWSKLRHILRVVVQETQVEWIERAQQSGCRELAIDIARTQRGERPKDKAAGGLPAQRIKVTASLSPMDHELWEQARRKVSAECDEPMTNEEMMVEIARVILRTDSDFALAGRTVVKHSPYQLIIHEDATGSHVHTAHGPVALTPWQADFMRRRAEVVPFARPVDEAGKTPANLARRIRARDDGRCQNCGAVIHLHVHHVVFRAHGGKTEESNLLCVCTRCHSLIHQGLLHVQGDGAGGYYFLGDDGRPVEKHRAGRHPRAGQASQAEAERTEGAHPCARSSQSAGYGAAPSRGRSTTRPSATNANRRFT